MYWILLIFIDCYIDTTGYGQKSNIRGNMPCHAKIHMEQAIYEMQYAQKRLLRIKGDFPLFGKGHWISGPRHLLTVGKVSLKREGISTFGPPWQASQVPIQLKHTPEYCAWVRMIVTGANKVNMHYHLIYKNQVLDIMVACFCAPCARGKDIRRTWLLPAF